MGSKTGDSAEKVCWMIFMSGWFLSTLALVSLLLPSSGAAGLFAFNLQNFLWLWWLWRQWLHAALQPDSSPSSKRPLPLPHPLQAPSAPAQLFSRPKSVQNSSPPSRLTAGGSWPWMWTRVSKGGGRALLLPGRAGRVWWKAPHLRPRARSLSSWMWTLVIGATLSTSVQACWTSLSSSRITSQGKRCSSRSLFHAIPFWSVSLSLSRCKWKRWESIWCSANCCPEGHLFRLYEKAKLKSYFLKTQVQFDANSDTVRTWACLSAYWYNARAVHQAFDLHTSGISCISRDVGHLLRSCEEDKLKSYSLKKHRCTFDANSDTVRTWACLSAHWINARAVHYANRAFDLHILAN